MVISEILSINNWRKASLEDLSGSLKNKNNSLVNYSWRNFKKELSPLSLYQLLKAKFGDANGICMFSKSKTTDNLIHWHYTFIVEKNEIHFLGKSSGIEILLKLQQDINFNKNDWTLLIDNIKSNCSQNRKQMMMIQSDLEKYTLFINPFLRLKDTLISQVEELKSIDTKEIQRIDTYNASDTEREAYYKSFNQWIINIKKSAALGTTIRMLSPVLAESFINLLIFVLATDYNKTDKRLYDNLIRQPIDIRVKTLHINCNDFIKPINGEGEEFKDFQTLMNNRNNFLHGNIDPTKLVFEEVYFDMKNIPLFKEDEGIITKTMKNYLNNVEAEKAINDYEVVKKFIDFVMSHINEKIREQIEHLLLTRMPGYNNETKRIGILFPLGLVE